jgi:tRNA-specific 2-thiouridylase
MKRVVIGLSGGVDSSVAAYLLKKQGYDVVAVFMINWKDSSVTLRGDCSWEEDIIVAKLVAKKLDIPLEVIDSSDRYKQSVVDYMFSEYEKGRTPNPDVLCNREIKFDIFREAAIKLGADYIATGHYARTEKIINNKGEFVRLLEGLDNNKDQSYFLCQLNQEQLKNVLFPVGTLEKPEVRKIAAELELASATKKDSQGICFIGKVDLPTFLQQKLTSKTGNVIEIEDIPNYFSKKFQNTDFNNIDVEMLKIISSPYNFGDFNSFSGKKIGEHKGAHFYTVGQRKGLNIGGKKEPLFVIGTDIEKNIIYVGEGHDHFGLNRKGLFIRNDEIHWTRPDLELKENEKLNCKVRIRYRQALQNAVVLKKSEGIYIIFEELQRGITPGQFAAWYVDDELIGSGVINA